MGYQRNTCLRAPGASCFSDLECAPSAFAASKANSVDLTAYLNDAEQKYWKEDLVCGNPDFKYVSANVLNPIFDIKKNVCCRETGKTLTVFTQTATSPYQWCDTATNEVKVAGVNTLISDSTRYSRVHTPYDKMTCNVSAMSSTKTFALSIQAPSNAQRMSQILNQFKTLDTTNQRTCCTQHWVRSLASSNGGGHKLERSKLQTIDKDMFRHVSWNQQDSTIITDSPFECNITNFANTSCEVKSFTPTEEDKYLTWAGSLELIGIPQVAIKTNDVVYKLVDDNQNTAPFAAGVGLPLNNSIKDVNTVGEDFSDATGRYYSGASYTKFNIGSGQLKTVFSESEFNCCIPSNQEVPTTTSAGQCCTGNLANVNGPLRCCLPDFADVTVYLNRYVSSEGRGLPDNSYDSRTGYIKDPGRVQLMASQKNLCCSGTVATGVAISQLNIPIEGGLYINPATQLSTSRRFNYRTDAVDNESTTGSVGTIFDAGVRWNNHVYCVPAGFGN